MSQVFPLIDGFIGYGDGLEAQLRSDEPWETTHPLVVERPEVFTAPEPDAPRPRPRKARGSADV